MGDEAFTGQPGPQEVLHRRYRSQGIKPFPWLSVLRHFNVLLKLIYGPAHRKTYNREYGWSPSEAARLPDSLARGGGTGARAGRRYGRLIKAKPPDGERPEKIATNEIPRCAAATTLPLAGV